MGLRGCSQAPTRRCSVQRLERVDAQHARLADRRFERGELAVHQARREEVRAAAATRCSACRASMSRKTKRSRGGGAQPLAVGALEGRAGQHHPCGCAASSPASVVSHAARSASVSGMPRLILSRLAALWKSSPSTSGSRSAARHRAHARLAAPGHAHDHDPDPFWTALSKNEKKAAAPELPDSAAPESGISVVNASFG
jgi:hypothetical protein